MRKRIHEGDWPPGTILPTWRALAKSYGVGVRVIQLATDSLKRDGMLATTPQRRLLSCDWDSSGTRLDKKILVLLTASPEKMFRSHQMTNLMMGLHSGSQRPLLTAFDSRLRTSVPQELLEDPLHGVVVLGKVSAQALRGYEKLNLPVVLADHPGKNWNLHAVGVNNEHAVRTGMEQLRALGHKRIALIRRIQMSGVYGVEPDSRERQAVFEKLLPDRPKGVDVFSIFPHDNVEKAFKPFLRARPRYTGVLASDYASGLMLKNTMKKEKGWTVPRDMSIVLLGHPLGEPVPFTGILFDYLDMGRTAMSLLDQPGEKPQHVKINGTWFKGRSIGPPGKSP